MIVKIFHNSFFFSIKNESVAEILQSLLKQLTNFNKRIITIEEGFFKTAKTILFYEQAKDFLNRNLTSSIPLPQTQSMPPQIVTPNNFQIQPNLFNEFLNIESKFFLSHFIKKKFHLFFYQRFNNTRND